MEWGKFGGREVNNWLKNMKQNQHSGQIFILKILPTKRTFEVFGFAFVPFGEAVFMKAVSTFATDGLAVFRNFDAGGTRELMELETYMTSHISFFPAPKAYSSNFLYLKFNNHLPLRGSLKVQEPIRTTYFNVNLYCSRQFCR